MRRKKTPAPSGAFVKYEKTFRSARPRAPTQDPRGRPDWALPQSLSTNWNDPNIQPSTASVANRNTPPLSAVDAPLRI